MASRKKVLANRANAQKSSGPVTETGREKVSQNSTKHGLCGRFKVLACEAQSDYDDLLERFLRDEQPANDVERELVAKMARHTWLAERAVRLQEGHFLIPPRSEEDIQKGEDTVAVLKGLELYLRYQVTHDRAYQRASDELARRRKERLLAKRGFVQQKRDEEREKRSERHEKRQIERHKYFVAIAEAKLERELVHTEKVKTAAANQTVPSKPPQMEPIAA